MWTLRLAVLLVLLLAGPVAAQAKRPNIVVVLADDLGYGDVSCYNSKSRIQTKSMDRLAAEGMRFTDAHSPSAVCTPTRYGLLTGRYCWRTSLKAGVLEGYSPPLIEAERTTLASFLCRLGYLAACIGKWHLGLGWVDASGTPIAQGKGRPNGANVDFTKPFRGGPTERGFDFYYGISASLDMPPYCYLENDRATRVPSGKFAGDGSLYMNLRAGAIADDFEFAGVLPRLTRRAVDFIEKQAAAEKPFFLYLPLPSPHVPIVPNAAFLGKSGAGKYGDFVLETDATLGAVMDALERTKQADNTLLILTSDNGSWWHYWDFAETDDRASGKLSPRGAEMKKFGHQGNGSLRGLKADIWEGGHRVPFLVRWPGKVRAGSTSDQLVVLTDLLATFAEVNATKLPANAGEDSTSFLPTLLGKTDGVTLRQDAVLHSHGGIFGLRSGKWLYVPQRGSGGFSSPVSVPKPGVVQGQLYDLEADPAQTRNLWQIEPAIVRRLAQSLEKIRRP